MIVILKRYDLPEEHRQQKMEDLQLEHTGLPADVIQLADVIVSVEGRSVKFLKHMEGLQSKETLETLLTYITYVEPEPFSWKGKGRREIYKNRYKKK
jgi:hypothetical protein